MRVLAFIEFFGIKLGEIAILGGIKLNIIEYTPH
jgi:hypothetical protein